METGNEGIIFALFDSEGDKQNNVWNNVIFKAKIQDSFQK